MSDNEMMKINDITWLLNDGLPVFYKPQKTEFELSVSNGCLVVKQVGKRYNKDKYSINWNNLHTILPYVLTDKTLQKYYDKKSRTK